MDSRLKNSIVQTLAYFDLFSHPLTKEEIFHWLWDCNVDYTDFVNDLDRVLETGSVGFKDGFYFLSGREEIVVERQRRVRLTEEKMRIAARAAKKLRRVPFLRAVFVCNTLAIGAVTAKSDIDVLIIAAEGRIWIVRFLSNFILKLFGLRTGKNKQASKICLSFFVTNPRLNMSDLAAASPDIYLIYWLSQLLPIYDPLGLSEEIKQKNIWAKKYLSRGWQDFALLRKYKVNDTRASRLVKRIVETMWGGSYGNLIENRARTIQTQKIKERGLANDEKNKNVVICDTMLKFHENDRRVEYWERWRLACGQRLKD